jgi:hypothetical protein
MNSSSSAVFLAPIGPIAIITEPSKGTNALREGFATLDPLNYPGWDSLLSAHGHASFFHSLAWARVLHDTYGHRPTYICRIADSGLRALLPIMEVSSWFTGRRGVSLPFTDVCPALKSTPADHTLYNVALESGRERGWRYFESRNNNDDWPEAQPSVSFYGHAIDLQGGPEAVFKRFSSALRRGIRKAQDQGVQIEFDTRPETIALYYSLHCRTRRKHGVPPQPFRFFENIGRHVFRAGQGFLAVARLASKPIAAAVFFHHQGQAFYKFGASDYRLQHLRPNNLLMWESMKRFAAQGFESVHLGRTSLSNEGLRRFKLGLGAAEQPIRYAKYDLKREAFVRDIDRSEQPIKRLFGYLPSSLFRLVGRLLYPHLS